MKETVINKIITEKIIAIVRGYSIEQCVRLASALCDGGVHMLEVTFPQGDRQGLIETADKIKVLKRELGDKMEFGAGTVTTVEMVEIARDAGATFIISPNTDESVIKATLESGMVSVPGAFTPSEIKHITSGNMCLSVWVSLLPHLFHGREGSGKTQFLFRLRTLLKSLHT